MKQALIAAFAALLAAWTAAVHAGALVDLAVVNRATGERIPIHAHRGRLYVDRKSTRLNSSHRTISYAVFCLKKNNSVRAVVDGFIKGLRTFSITASAGGYASASANVSVLDANLPFFF